MPFFFEVVRGRDPNAVAVLLEDSAAVAGLFLAAGCLGLTSYTGNIIFDAIGSITIGGMLISALNTLKIPLLSCSRPDLSTESVISVINWQHGPFLQDFFQNWSSQMPGEKSIKKLKINSVQTNTQLPMFIVEMMNACA